MFNRFKRYLRRLRPKYKVGDHVMDSKGQCWVIDSISRDQFVIHLLGTTITHAEVRSSMERYSAHRPPSGV